MATTREAQDAPSSARSWLVVAILAIAGTVVSLQQTLVIPLLPDLPRLLDTTPDNASWLVTSTLLSGAVATPVASRLADMHGKRRMVVALLVLMIAGSVLNALSTSLLPAVTARALQGCGMAIIPIGIAIMRDELPAEKVPTGVSLMSASLAVGAGAGMPLAGWLADTVDWHFIFWVTAAFGAVMLVAVVTLVGESPVRTGGTFDLAGAIVLSVGLLGVLVTLSKGGQWGWTTVPTAVTGLIGVGALVLFVPLALRARNPLVDVRTAVRPAVLLVNIASLLTGIAMYTNMLVTSTLLQLPPETGYGLGFDALHTGLWMAPSAVAFGLFAPVSAAITRRYGPVVSLLVGTLLMGVVYAVRAVASETLAQIVVGSFLVAIGTSIAYAAMPTLILRSVPLTETASANGLNTLLRSVGTSVASAVTALVVSASTTRVGSGSYPTFGSQMGLLVLAAAAAFGAGFVVVPLLRSRTLATREAPETRDSVARGRATGPDGRAATGAVVTVVGPGGQHVDWGRVDGAGDYAVAIPGPGDYLLVCSAPGFRPASRITTIADDLTIEPLTVSRQSRISGRVTLAGAPVADAGVVLTRASGEVESGSRTDDDGHYALPMPTDGRFVLTVVERRGPAGAVRSVPVVGSGEPRVVDVDLGREV